MRAETVTDPVVLLVEDDPGVRNALRRLLEHQLLSVAEASTLGEAREAIRHHAASLRAVVVDLGLGEENGLDLVDELHRQHSALRVIVFSAQNDRVPLESFRDYGVEAVLAKPASPAAIVATVRRALDGETPKVTGDRERTHPWRGNDARS